MVGDFLTQFYYYLYAGATILTLSLLLLGDLTRRGLEKSGIKRHAYATAIILMTIEAYLCMDLSYRLSSIIALVGSAFMFLIFKYTLPRKGLAELWCAIIAILTYWMFGYGVLLFMLLATVDAVTHYTKRQMMARILSLVLILVLIPLSKNHYILDTGKLLTYPGIGKFVKPDFNLQKDIAADTEYYFGNYNAVERIVEKCKNPSAHMKFYYNLIQAQRGVLPEKLMVFKPNELGTFYSINEKTPIMTIKDMNELYWVLGDMMFTERAATIANSFSPENRNVRMIKRLAEVNIVSNDTAAAMKYLRLLRQTVAYRKFAENIINGEPKVMRKYEEKRKYINKTASIRTSDNTHQIMSELLRSNPQNNIALDYILCSDLLLKDIVNFKRDYDLYCMGQDNQRIHAIYQQALCIYLAGTNAPQEEWDKYIKRPDVMQQFAQYNNQRANSAFSSTYWYYFDTTNPDIKE